LLNQAAVIISAVVLRWQDCYLMLSATCFGYTGS